jgi:hypothetical protein
MRQYRRARLYSEVPEVPRTFLPGDAVRATDDDSLGTVQYSRADGMICVLWRSGTREWCHESSLAHWRGQI